MLQSVNVAAKELGLNLGQTPIHALKDTPQVHHVIEWTLSSCYPASLLGEKPDCYKLRTYRARVVREPPRRPGGIWYPSPRRYGRPRAGQHRRTSLYRHSPTT